MNKFRSYKNFYSGVEEVVPKGKENLKLINTKVIEEVKATKNKCRQVIEISLKKSILEIGEKKFNISYGDKNFSGEFVVVEKWKNPYFKGKNYFFYPGKDTNPLGEYLIILGKQNGEGKIEKIPQGIHTLFKFDTGKTTFVRNFKKGYKPGLGCIRLSYQDLEDFFNLVELGAKVIIKN